MDDKVSTKLDMDITILVGEFIYMYIHVGHNM